MHTHIYSIGVYIPKKSWGNIFGIVLVALFAFLKVRMEDMSETNIFGKVHSFGAKDSHQMLLIAYH